MEGKRNPQCRVAWSNATRSTSDDNDVDQNTKTFYDVSAGNDFLLYETECTTRNLSSSTEETPIYAVPIHKTEETPDLFSLCSQSY